MQYVIKTHSAIGRFGLCNLGAGPTEKDAWEDAIGPKPWTAYQRMIASESWCVKIESDEPVSYSGH